MAKYKEIDYRSPRSRWMLWVIPFLVAILLVLIGLLIFITFGAKNHRCLFFDCEQPRDKVVKPGELRNDEVVIPEKEESKKHGLGNSSQEEINRVHHKESFITVHGELIFDGIPPQSLPSNSSLKVKLEDVSVMDAPSVELGKSLVDLSNYNGKQNLQYSIKAEKPSDRGRYSVSAVLNMGWQADEDSWIRKGDYFTDTSHPVVIVQDTDVYERNVTLVRYS